jgi:hypothetical protein
VNAQFFSTVLFCALIWKFRNNHRKLFSVKKKCFFYNCTTNEATRVADR